MSARWQIRKLVTTPAGARLLRPWVIIDRLPQSPHRTYSPEELFVTRQMMEATWIRGLCAGTFPTFAEAVEAFASYTAVV